MDCCSCCSDSPRPLADAACRPMCAVFARRRRSSRACRVGAQPSSHDGSAHVHSRTRSVRGMQLMAAGWDFADIQNQLDGIVRNKAIYLNVATALGPFSTLDPLHEMLHVLGEQTGMKAEL